MILAIAIIAGIGYILSIIQHVSEHDTFDVNLPIAAILVISTWEICLPIAIIVIVISALMTINMLFSKR